MDTASAKRGRGANDAVVNAAMAIHLISDNILNHLPVRDILNVAAVNRLWNIVGRKYTREKRQCLVEINCSHSCRELRGFANFLATTAPSILPFNGLSIRVTKNAHEDCVDDVSMRTLRSFFQTQFRLKFLSVHWDSETRCVVEQFLREIFSGDLQGLTLSKVPETITSLREYFKVGPDETHPNLPNLKVVKISDVRNHNVIHELISAAPEVKKIVGTVDIEQLEGFMTEGKAPFITDFEFYPTPTSIELCSRLADTKPELESLAVLADSYFPVGRMGPFAQTLLALTGSSASSLKVLNIDQMNMIMLSEYCVPPFPLLHNLQLGFADMVDELEGYESLARINYGRLFPNLKRVDIDKEVVSNETLSVYKGCEFWKGEKQEEQRHTCSVPTLSINHSHLWSSEVFQSFASVFPNVKELHIEFDHTLRDFISLLWTNWPNVESITLETKDICLLKNMDCLFTGISSEEGAMLSKMSPELLEVYEYAAVRPCIINLTRLKTLRFNVQNAHSKCRHRLTNGSFLSGLTGYLAFSRMPGLRVELSRTECARNVRCGFVQQSLLPFVNISGSET